MGLLSFLLPSWKLTGVAILASTAIGGVGGFRLAENLCNAQEQKIEIAARDHTIYDLQQKIKDQASILEADALAAQADSEAMAKLSEEANVLKGQIGAGTCFSSDDVDRLREFWGATNNPQPTRKGLFGYGSGGH
jgi:hypothetical protein